MAEQQENLAAVLHKKDDIRIENRPIPEPGENEVLLRMSCVGICGSDVHYVQHGRIGDYIVKKPIVLGHEGAGVVIKLGSGVKNLKVGDRVAVEPSIPCRRCYYCKHGRYNLCTDMSYCATPPDDGNLLYYYKHPSDFCHRYANLIYEAQFLILGFARILYLKVLMTDVVAHRLEMAKTFGADYTLQVFPGESVVQQSAKICSLLTKAPDITIDCCGIESTVRLGLEATCTGGKLVIVGLGGSPMKLELGRGIFREVDVCGVFRFCNVYPASLALVASQKINVKALITHNFHLKDTIKAFETAISGDGNPIKIMIHCN
ncbi:sorbitol dehydrogenase-like [Schistocerca americana]|uniref:sorbitol dehydrogenase-like n=1 Tax=Schistocerca americana TaxID=7009 RepID=UPI001F4F3207|nr:sorbitol dehydrogenase-like [Schistocerca americana]